MILYYIIVHCNYYSNNNNSNQSSDTNDNKDLLGALGDQLEGRECPNISS